MRGFTQDRPEAFLYKSGGEQRGVRCLKVLCINDRLDDIPTDTETLNLINRDILNTISYCFLSTREHMMDEREIINELDNVATVIKGFFRIDEGRLTYDFNKILFRYLIIHGNNYKKEDIVRLLTGSRLLSILSTCICNVGEFYFERGLMYAYYNDPHIRMRDKDKLYLMTCSVCEPEGSVYNFRQERLTYEDTIFGIYNGRINGHDKEVAQRLRKALEESDKDTYIRIRDKIVSLYETGLIDEEGLKEYMEDSMVYTLIKAPDTVDYEKLDLDILRKVRSVRTITRMMKYGGYDLFYRVRRKYRREPEIMNYDVYRMILLDRRYCDAE